VLAAKLIPSIEIVVVDMGSTDATAMLRYLSRESHHPVKVIRQVNSGVQGSRRGVWNEARGEFHSIPRQRQTLLLPQVFPPGFAPLQRRLSVGICYGRAGLKRIMLQPHRKRLFR